MAIKPLTDRVVAEKDAEKKQTASGILLGPAEEKSNTATIVAVGPEVKHLKKGDHIIYKEYSTTEIKYNQKDYLILKEEDVLATL